MGVNNLANNSSLMFSKEKNLFKNTSVQSVSAIYEKNSDGGICILLATRNGDVFVMREPEGMRKIDPKANKNRLKI